MRDIHLFVLNTMADWEPGYAIAAIAHPAADAPSRGRVRTVGLDRNPVRTQGGVTILPDIAVADLRANESSLLILPGSDLWADPATDGILAKAREFLDAGVPVAAICGATLGLARAGLLDTRKHTSNAPAYLASTHYRGADRYVHEAAVDDGGVITASGMAPLEFARAILERLKVFPAEALDAWYRFNKNRDSAAYLTYLKALGNH